MKLSFLTSAEKKRISETIKEEYGLSDLPYLLVQSGKERIMAFSGHMSRDEIVELSKIANVEIIGMYLLKESNGFKLSFDATQVLSQEIKKNIIDLAEEQAKAWMSGGDIEIKVQKGFVVLRHNGDLLGCGKSNGEKIFNYVPKERRIKNRNI